MFLCGFYTVDVARGSLSSDSRTCYPRLCSRHLKWNTGMFIINANTLTSLFLVLWTGHLLGERPS